VRHTPYLVRERTDGGIFEAPIVRVFHASGPGRSSTERWEAPITRTTFFRILLAGASAALAWLAIVYLIPAAGAGHAWNDIERVSLEHAGQSADDGAGSDALGEMSGVVALGPSTTTTVALTSTIPDDEIPSTVLLVGSDSRANLEDLAEFGDFVGQRADVIVLAMISGDEVSLLSIPRDLAVEDSCDGGVHKIGEAYEGCDGGSGLGQLVTEVEALTGVEVEHAASIDMAGFQATVDAVDGYEICTEYPLRDLHSGLALDAGCQTADGETTLAWIRSRHTQQYVDGAWEVYPAVSDLVRNERQREFLIDMLHRIGNDLSVDQVLAVAQEVAPFMTIDDQLSLRDVVRLGWQFRDADVEVLEIPVIDDTLDNGTAVLVPAGDIEAMISGT
jgi:LCP family protein required for cell wall assembly